MGEVENRGADRRAGALTMLEGRWTAALSVHSAAVKRLAQTALTCLRLTRLPRLTTRHSAVVSRSPTSDIHSCSPDAPNSDSGDGGKWAFSAVPKVVLDGRSCQEPTFSAYPIGMPRSINWKRRGCGFEKDACQIGLFSTIVTVTVASPCVDYGRTGCMRKREARVGKRGLC